MFDTIEEISRNKFLCRLVEESSGFGMYGAYIKYMKADNPFYNGFYFVCGYDAKDVVNKDANLEKLYEKQKNSTVMRLDLHITKITNQSPFNVHQDVMNYCLHASTMRGLINKYGFNKYLQYVSPPFVTMIECFYLNSVDSALSFTQKEKWDKITETLLNTEGEREFILRGLTGDGPEVHMKPEKLDKKCPNMVSLEELAYKTLCMEKMTLTLELLPKIKQELNKHPDILYFQTKPVVVRLKVPDNQGYGSKEANQMTSVLLIYDANYSKQMDLIYLRAKYPQCFKYSIADIKKEGKGTCSFGISIADLECVFREANERKIPICIDEKKLYFSCDNKAYSKENIAGYTVTIPKDDTYINQMDNILVGEAIRARDARILRRGDIEEYSYLNKELKRLPEE